MEAIVSLGGKRRPLTFVAQVAYYYELRTGRVFLADVMQLLNQMANAEEAIASGRVEDGLKAVSNVLFADIAYEGLCYAARKRGEAFDAEPADVHAWLYGDAEAIKEVVTLLVNSLPRADNGAAEGDEKKITGSSRALRRGGKR